MAGSKAIGSIHKFWDMGENKTEQKQIEPMTKERYEAILKRHNIKVN